MSLDISALTARGSFLEGDAVDAVPAEGIVAQEYKQFVVRRYLSLNGEEIENRLGGSAWQVTRKLDGELAVLFFDGDRVFTVNTGGRVRTGLAVHEQAKDCLRKVGLTAAVIPCELYVAEDDGRTRVFDVSAALANDPEVLRLAPFDIISLNGEEQHPSSYLETHAKLSDIFASDLVRPVQMQAAGSRQEVAAIYAEWVTKGGAEGLVVRTDSPWVFKIKPTYTLDVAVIGYSENPENPGQVRSMLVALIATDGRFQPVGHVGSGLTETTRSEFHARLSPAEVGSTYIETDANHVAFHMVKPELVIEIKVNDVLFDSTNGPITNPLLEFDGSWQRTGTTVGASIVHPVLARVRDDKAVNATDVRLSQIDEYFAWPTPPTVTNDELPASTVLRREVYTKTLSGHLMVQKFMVWRTNKGGQDFPDYVLAYTNFSPGRKDPLTTEVRLCATEEEALTQADAMVADKIKAGWKAS